MLTLFTTAKPFREHSGIIQHNALKSWTLIELWGSHGFSCRSVGERHALALPE